ncbi:alpha/beta fold hydrolase [Streptomyces sp. NBC_01429]|uniref:alpha/beta fold hydrolase n=1 Tax=Streptomyces sp. NBC_01429 TaxID=2903862 RepID=UPI002E2C2BA3|nr:alpha/beta hydrolase [Streptomyces sp. NBC_01429]
MAWSERIVTRDGVRLVCRDWGGPGTPIVLLHGLAGHSGEWDAAARHLSPGHRVVAVDQRGHGASERHAQDVSRAAYVADVIAVIDQMGLRRPVLVGQSLGGHTAMLTAAAHPDRVRALVLIEAGPGSGNPDTSTEIGVWLDSWPVPFTTREAAAQFFGGGSVGAGWAAGLEERDGGWWPRFDRDVMVRSLAENSQRPFWDEWEQVRCPTLVVLAQSSFVPPPEADGMLRRGPVTVAASIPRTGHDLHLEQPGTLCTLLSDFLDGLA